jgi:hypothetical protein
MFKTFVSLLSGHASYLLADILMRMFAVCLASFLLFPSKMSARGWRSYNVQFDLTQCLLGQGSELCATLCSLANSYCITIRETN